MLDGQRARVGIKDIKSDGMLRVVFDIKDILRPLDGDAVGDLLGALAVRVDEGHAVPGVNVIQRHALEQGGFAHAGCPDDVEVPPPVIGR